VEPATGAMGAMGAMGATGAAWGGFEGVLERAAGGGTAAF